MVPRNLVVVEIATGTWCVYCPGSALAADDMHANGDPVAIIEHHGGGNGSDPYETPESGNRINYYNVAGFPTAYFDGQNASVGGDATNTIYPTYLPKINSSIGVNTPLEVEFDLVNPAGNDYEIVARIDQVATIPTGNFVLEVVVTESHIPVTWFGLTEINEVNRMMLPDDNGTALTLNGVGSSDTINLNFTLPPTFVKSNCELIVFIQDLNSKIIYNGAKSTLDLASIPVDMSAVKLKNSILKTYCEDEIAPVVNIANTAGPALTSLVFEYRVNGGADSVFAWTGYLESGDSLDVSLPSYAFTPMSSGNVMDIELVNPNGLNDPDMSNNTLTRNWDKPSHPAGTYTVQIKLDNYGSEITWEARDATGALAGSGGPYANNTASVITETFEVAYNGGQDCYNFSIFDSWGDGLTWLQNPGWFKVIDPMGNVVDESTDGNFGAKAEINFEASWTTALEPQLNPAAVSVFPNPNSGLFTVRLAERPTQAVNLELYQISGQLVKEVQTQQLEYAFDIANLPAGIYLLKVRTAEGVLTEKITKF